LKTNTARRGYIVSDRPVSDLQSVIYLNKSFDTLTFMDRG